MNPSQNLGKTNCNPNVENQSESKKKGLPDNYRPSLEEAKRYIKIWDSLPNYLAHENSLTSIFRGDESPYRENRELRDIILKVSVLNDFYSTNIYRVYQVAEKIKSIEDFDERLSNGDLSLVDDFQEIEYQGSQNEVKHKRNYSFATKYCSHHQPDKFPIYDSYVEKVLCDLKSQYPCKFSFHKKDLRNYKTYVKQLDILVEEFGLQELNYKMLDRYLWQLGKRYFAKYKDAVNGEIDYAKFGL